MKNAMQRLKKHNKKGFTLVELLVVLVILAILAAAIIPSMMGFIDRAKKESVAAEQRSVLLAAQVEVNEMYGKNLLKEDTAGTGTMKIEGEHLAAIQTVADLPGTINSITVTINSKVTGTKTADHWTITGAEYTDKSGKIKYTYAVDLATGEGTWDTGTAVTTGQG